MRRGAFRDSIRHPLWVVVVVVYRFGLPKGAAGILVHLRGQRHLVDMLGEGARGASATHGIVLSARAPDVSQDTPRSSALVLRLDANLLHGW